MRVIEGIAGVLLVSSVLWDAFETILLPRRISNRNRISRWVIRISWWGWRTLAKRLPVRRREGLLSTFAILSLLELFAVWAVGLMIGFALLQVAAGSHLMSPGGPAGFVTALYYSGTTFLTLGLGDVEPVSSFARLLSVAEAGTGFGFLALVIAYLPVLYQAFSRREVRVTMLDQWAASPPTAAVVLRRAFENEDAEVIQGLLRDWEVISSELLESHISYPVLAFFRSQHDNQSWLASLTTVLDTCALVLAGVRGVNPFQARLTFAIARHAVVDMTQAFHLRPRAADDVRLSPEMLEQMRAWLRDARVPIAESAEAGAKLTELRALYEPYVCALSDLLLMPLPGWLPPDRLRFNWETTAWAKTVSDEAH